MTDAKDSLAAHKFFAEIIDVMQENEEFVRNKAKETYVEIIELINDAIDENGRALGKQDREKDYVECATTFFTYHVLMPFSYAIYLDMLAGNIPACFMEVRFILESLAKCYLADTRHSEIPFFQERLTELDRETTQTGLSISKAMKELGEKLGAKEDFVALWGKLSYGWLHTKGLTDKLVDYVTQKSDMPPWAMVIPMKYTENDLGFLEELRSRVSQLRNLITITMRKYRQENVSSAG